jgi:hypothetical protein
MIKLQEEISQQWYLLVSTDEQKGDANCENYELNCHRVLPSTPLDYKYCGKYACNKVKLLFSWLHKLCEKLSSKPFHATFSKY